MTKKQSKPEKSGVIKPDPRIYKYFIPAALLVLVFLITTFKISGDDDIFWHLETGKYIAENKVIPSTDVFGFSTRGQEWIPFEWGFDVLAYNIYKFSGYAGLSVFRSIIFILIFYLFIRISVKLKLNTFIVYFILLLLILALFERLLIKPQIISYLFTALTLYIFLDYRHIKRENNRIIYWLPPIFLFWANMHMGVLSGIVLFTIFVISEIAAYSKLTFLNPGAKEIVNPSTKKDLQRIILVYTASIAVLLINPHGIYTYTYVYSHLNMKMMEDVFEWRSPFHKMFEGTMYIYIYYTYIAGAIISMIFFIKKRNIFSGLTLLIFLLLSFRSARFTIDFMLIASIFMIITLDGLLINPSKNTFLRNPILKPSLIVIMIVVIILLPGSNMYKYFNYDRETGFGVDKKNYPVGAVNFLKENNIVQPDSKPFNTYSCGGYLIWEIPGAMNFIDSRGLNDDIYYNFKTINNKLPGFEQKFESYGFDYILWFYPKLPWNNTELKTSILSYLFKNNEKWKLVYWDDNSFVFVKNDNRYKDIIDKFEFKYVNPYYYIFDKEPLKNATYSDPQRIAEEIRRNYRLNPEGIFIQAMAKSFNVKP